QTLRAAVLASQALDSRPGGGLDVSGLQFADMSAVADQFRNAPRLDGEPYSSKSRLTLFGLFCELLDFGRRAGLLDQMPGSFSRDQQSHRIDVESSNEDEIGKAIPEFVIRQLDAQLDLLGVGCSYGHFDSVDVQAMFRTVYII